MQEDEVAILSSVTELVVLYEEKELCEGIHMFLGPAILEDLLDVDVFRMEEAAKREFMVCLHISQGFDGSHGTDSEDVVCSGYSKGVICLESAAVRGL